MFLPFSDFPWFRDASIAQITYVERPATDHLHWPDLDVDVSLESIESPERFPLVSRMPVKRRSPAKRARSGGRSPKGSRPRGRR